MDVKENSTKRKKCGYLDNHVCPLELSAASKGEPCNGCDLFEKILAFKELSLKIEGDF